MNKFSKITHFAGLALAATGAFLVTPAGQALIQQYPHLEPVAFMIASLVALYHKPTQGGK